MTPTEQAAFDALVAELDAALARLNEPSVRVHPSFSIEPDWYPEALCVIAERDNAAGLRFMLEGDWIRVDMRALTSA